MDCGAEGCIRFTKISDGNDLVGESMAIKALGLINKRLKFLYRKQHFLSTLLRRLLCNALIQPHYDYACSAWYPNLNDSSKRFRCPKANASGTV